MEIQDCVEPVFPQFSNQPQASLDPSVDPSLVVLDDLIDMGIASYEVGETGLDQPRHGTVRLLSLDGGSHRSG